MLTTDNDTPDFKKVKEGDPLAHKFAYAILWGVGDSVCRCRVGRTGMDIELIVQDAACETLGKLDALGSWDSLRKMMVIITRNKLVDAVRRFSAEKRGGGSHPLPLHPLPLHPLPLQDFLIHPSLPTYQQPDNTLIRKEIYMAFIDCSNLLAERAREIMSLRLLNGLGQKDISSQLGIPQGTVGVLIMRSLTMLRDCLNNKGFSPE